MTFAMSGRGPSYSLYFDQDNPLHACVADCDPINVHRLDITELESPPLALPEVRTELDAVRAPVAAR
jgi:hypothetical protein